MGSLGYKVPDGEFAHPLISERAIDEPRPLKVICIGAGVSGICAAIQFPKYVPNLDLVIYEKNEDVGGTWWENRYPGVACDIPAHSYQLSFESHVEWSQFYASGPEILKYWQRVTDKYDVRKYMKFSSKCVAATWNEETSKWHVKILDLDTNETFEDVADVFMSGAGTLNDWKWPDISGLKDFKGTLLHSANWDKNFGATNKTVAVLGAGSSGIQIVPSLLPTVSHMDHYVRGRTWISASFGAELVRARCDGEDGNFTYTPEEMAAWRSDPDSYIQYRKALEVGMQGGYAVTHRNTPAHNMAWKAFAGDMRQRLARKPEIADHLLPEFPPLCKRLTPGPGYLESLTSDKCTVIPTPISHITSTGIVTNDGKERNVDAIICATGFDTSFHHHRITITGRNGVTLKSRWKTRPETYLSLAVDGFPNYFQSLGPNAGVGAGNLLIIIEAIVHYVGQCLQHLSRGNVVSLAPKPRCVQNFSDYCDAYFARTVFSAECGSWYKSSPEGSSAEERRRGRVTALWPGSSVHAVRALERVRLEDYEIKYAGGNEFGWFGDGWAVAERAGKKGVEGLCWYLNGSGFLHRSLEEDGKEGRGGVVVNGLGGGEKLTNGLANGDVGSVLGKEEENVPDGIAAT